MITQRTTPREVELAWLAGIIDGEGTIGAYFYFEQKNSPKYGIWIVNSDYRMLIKAKEILDTLGVVAWFGDKEYAKSIIGKRRMWQIKVGRKADVKKVLESIVPYLVAKKEQAEILINFFNKFPQITTSSRQSKELYPEYVKLVAHLKQAKLANGAPVETKR